MIYVTGQTVEAALNSGGFARVHPADLARTQEDFRTAIDAGLGVHNEHRLLCIDGTYRWQLARVLPNHDPSGRIVSWYGTSTDIDDLKQPEADLRAKTGLLRIAGQLCRVGGWELDLPEWKFSGSDEVSRILELPEGSVLTLKAAIGLCTPTSQPLANAATQACVEHGTPFDMEVEMLTGTGRSIWVRSMGQAVRNASGRIVHIHGALQDVTERVKAQQDVKAQLHTLQRAAEAARTITMHQTLDATLHEAAEQVRTTLGAQQAVICIAHPASPGGKLSARALSSNATGQRKLLDDPQANRIQTQVCNSNRPLRLTRADLMTDADADADADAGINADADSPAAGRHIGAYPVGGWLTVPLTGRQGQNIGFLQLSDKQGGEFTQQDEYLATELAQLAAITIENINLLTQVGHLNSGLEAKIAQRTLAEQAPHPIWTTDTQGGATFYSKA